MTIAAPAAKLTAVAARSRPPPPPYRHQERQDDREAAEGQLDGDPGAEHGAGKQHAPTLGARERR
jgi:hypothetical protein